MKTKPILFSGPMVTAILDGRKTMTRRAITPQPSPHHWEHHKQYRLNVKLLDTADGTVASFQHELVGVNIEDPSYVKCPYSADLLYVRETFSGYDQSPFEDTTPPRNWPPETPIHYWADGEPACGNWTIPKPSIHMPRKFSRLTLKITGIRVERLQDITEEDALAEGIDEDGEIFNLSQNILDNIGVAPGASHDIPKSSPAIAEFKHLWDSINGKPRKDGADISWDANPWVWVVEFEPIMDNIDSVLGERIWKK